MGNENILQLGITKIGDLLLENKVTNIGEGKSEIISLCIPEYQRPYKWTARNVNQLLDDIVEARQVNREIYRVGTLILHKEKKDNYDIFNIVDGQQRVITFSLLLQCIKKDATIPFLQQKLSNSSYSIHNVINNYRAFERRIARLEAKEKEELAEYICNYCELIVVITTDQSEAFQFFDSQNARGKALYPHDLLKAYHLREMSNVDEVETAKVVGMWESLDQRELASMFNKDLYCLKEWLKGNRAYKLTEKNIDIFKGITAQDNYPYAQYYKGALAYANRVNRSDVPFALGIKTMSPFQLNAPIIAGKPFFEYAKHYFDILADIRNNDKYEGYFINDNDIVKTLDLCKYKEGVGNEITRRMFDLAILLYVDRFCPIEPSKNDLDYLEHFVVFAFVWAYSMRAQYQRIDWRVAQNYIMGTEKVVNSFNIYKVISDTDSPVVLFSKLADLLMPLDVSKVNYKRVKDDIGKNINEYQPVDGVYQNYLYYFNKHKFLRGEDND